MAQQRRFWQTDANGLIVNDTNIKYINPSFDTIIQACVAAYTQNIEVDLHSIYVTGSIPRGLAVPGNSDINIIGVLAHHVDADLVMQDWMPVAEKAIQGQFAETLIDVDFDLFAHGFVFRDPTEFSIGAFILKTHALCVWGSDITPELPDYNIQHQPMRLAIANDDIVQLADDIADTRAELDLIDADDTDAIQGWCRRVCRQILHAGYGLVMEHTKQHTRDLDLSCEHFTIHYPAQAAAMQQTLALAINPSPDKKILETLLNTHGEFILMECAKWLNRYNPECDAYFLIADEDDAL
ncbi:MAG: hypothetical protein ACPG7F_18015 [Aggregatilineales bacterium]